MEKWCEKARRYSERAEELRTIASAVRHAPAWLDYLNAAEQYDEETGYPIPGGGRIVESEQRAH